MTEKGPWIVSTCSRAHWRESLRQAQMKRQAEQLRVERRVLQSALKNWRLTTSGWESPS